MRRKLSAIVGCSILAASNISAQVLPEPVPADAPAEPNAIPLYGESNPGSVSDEIWMAMGDNLAVRNVSYPTLTPFLPEPGTARGTAVIVAPGGGFMALVMDHEGWEVAEALAERGITAFVLKYRLIETPPNNRDAIDFMMQRGPNDLDDPMNSERLGHTLAPTDALAALAYVRENATHWGVTPDRVGMIGFSAGATTALEIARAQDPTKRPDFFGYIYGSQIAVEVPEHASPMFVGIAWDDHLFPSRGFAIAEAWHEAGLPVELHAYQTGGHGFGLGDPGTTNAMLIDEFVAWIEANGWSDSRKKD